MDGVKTVRGTKAASAPFRKSVAVINSWVTGKRDAMHGAAARSGEVKTIRAGKTPPAVGDQRKF